MIYNIKSIQWVAQLINYHTVTYGRIVDTDYCHLPHWIKFYFNADFKVSRQLLNAMYDLDCYATHRTLRVYPLRPATVAGEP